MSPDPEGGGGHIPTLKGGDIMTKQEPYTHPRKQWEQQLTMNQLTVICTTHVECLLIRMKLLICLPGVL